MPGIKHGRLEKIWQRQMARTIEDAGHTVTVHYHKTMTATGAGIDAFLGESVDGSDPFTGLTNSGAATLTLSGQIVTGFSGGRNVRESEEFVHSPFGQVRPGDRIFRMKLDAVPADAFVNVRYIELSTETPNYHLVGEHNYGMINPYITVLLLRRSEDVDLTGA